MKLYGHFVISYQNTDEVLSVIDRDFMDSEKSFLSIRGGQTQYLIAVPLDGTVSICGQIHMESIELDRLL